MTQDYRSGSGERFQCQRLAAGCGPPQRTTLAMPSTVLLVVEQLVLIVILTSNWLGLFPQNYSWITCVVLATVLTHFTWNLFRVVRTFVEGFYQG